MPPDLIHLVGPGGAGKTTTGAALARHLRFTFVDLDERFAAIYGDVSDFLDAHEYALYASRNVQTYLDVIEAATAPQVLALSSGFMTYATGVHPEYARLHRKIATGATTFVLLPSLDYETCVTETVRRQRTRAFARSAEREEGVIRRRFGVYRDLPATKLETMKPVPDVVEAVAAHWTRAPR